MPTWPSTSGTKSRTDRVAVSYRRIVMVALRLRSFLAPDVAAWTGSPGQGYWRCASTFTTSALATAATPSSAAGEPQPVGRRGRHRHRSTDGLGQRRLGFGPARSQPWPVADHLQGDVADVEAGGAHQPGRLCEQGGAGGPRPPRVVGAEDGTRRHPDPQHRAARRRRRAQRRRRRCARRTRLARRGRAGRPGASAGRARAGGRRRRCRRGAAQPPEASRCASTASASSRSSGRVTLNASSAPGTTTTRPPCRSTWPASSVASPPSGAR